MMVGMGLKEIGVPGFGRIMLIVVIDFAVSADHIFEHEDAI